MTNVNNDHVALAIPNNHPAIANVGPDQAVNESSKVMLFGLAIDPDPNHKLSLNHAPFDKISKSGDGEGSGDISVYCVCDLTKLIEISSLPYRTTRIMLIKTKRLGRYHHLVNNNNNDNSSSSSYFNELASLYKDNSRRSFLDWNKPLFGHKSSSLLANANKTTERATKFINKIKSRQLACDNRAKSIPNNATIRKEYIKCGKEMCEIEHGPYYYAYWRDPESKKLKQKYIGDHIPKNKESNDDSTNRHVL